MKRLWLLLIVCACARKPPLPILNYHSIRADGSDPFSMSPESFAAQLDWLAKAGYRTVLLHDLLEGRREKAVVLTFDDGTADAVSIVLPALRRRGMRATFFIATGLVGTPGFMNWAEIEALAAAGMEIGSHTVSHAHLADLPGDRVREELISSKAELERHLGRPVEAIAYPYNSVRWSIVRAARSAGYRIGVSGPSHGGGDLINLERISLKRGITLPEYQRAVEGLPAH